MGLTRPLSLDNIIKYTRPPWNSMEEGKQDINERIQYLE